MYHCKRHFIIIYPTLLRRVQIMCKTSTKYYTIFVLVSFPRPHERFKSLASQNLAKRRWIISPLLNILVRPCLSGYGYPLSEFQILSCCHLEGSHVAGHRNFMKRWDFPVGIMFNNKDYKSLWLALLWLLADMIKMAEKSSVTGFQTTRPHQAMFIVFYIFKYYTKCF